MGDHSGRPTTAGMEVSRSRCATPARSNAALPASRVRPNGGLSWRWAPAPTLHRGAIIASAARHRLPAVMPIAYFVTAGGLICYGPDPAWANTARAGYVDRILKGEKPADLRWHAPTKYELVTTSRLRRRSARKSSSVLARADEVIE